jgi:hypothetical protein
VAANHSRVFRFPARIHTIGEGDKSVAIPGRGVTYTTAWTVLLVVVPWVLLLAVLGVPATIAHPTIGDAVYLSVPAMAWYLSVQRTPDGRTPFEWIASHGGHYALARSVFKAPDERPVVIESGWRRG